LSHGASVASTSAAGTDSKENDCNSKQPTDSTPASASQHKYPHDAREVLLQLFPDAHVDTVEFRSDFRKAVAELRRLERRGYDLFINLYDRSDETGQRIVDYMEQHAMAFTGAGSRFYDPTREVLKMHCRYSNVDTPMFCLLDDAEASLGDPETAQKLIEDLGGFPLFVKPEHGFDSTCFFQLKYYLFITSGPLSSSYLCCLSNSGVGIDEKSMVHDLPSFRTRAEKVIDDWGETLPNIYIYILNILYPLISSHRKSCSLVIRYYHHHLYRSLVIDQAARWSRSSSTVANSRC
jgi:hypothetical protein